MYSRKRMTALSAAGMSAALLLTACGGGGGESLTGPEEGGEDAKEINIALIAWEEGIAVTHMWQAILEEKGYDVTITDVDVAPMYQGAANGDVDLFLDTWLPVTHADYWEDYGDQLEDLGAWYDNAKLTITVPSYMEDVNSISDLTDHADELGGRIVGIDPGAGLTRVTQEEAMPGYGLDGDFELVTSSTAAMLAELDSAITEEEPIVVTLWRPHPAYAQYDLKDLEDPEGLMGDAETIHAVGRDGFGEEYPELTGWLESFQLSDDELATLEVQTLQEHQDDPEAGARAWLAENPEFLERTLGGDAEGLEF
ncbi:MULTISPECIES: glycine betaine ABC transporter substrate-binding protein [Nocardiopsis]|uniref:Substrate-binding region of ABC-type glycine betaine transport system n=1 Tax=Nocardiopsis dassonvillei (strain ATCC 23218 / DSM 43111 / CIP 107115 / JCM 7437 / KCTC 9190 / NBRC 14626 / NCTC 10488 / NRRL B-5397 / IMRU 509) TaxID=446468 RepID=D7AY47_NOCDD|nr:MULTISPECIES: glycine betaine ABC transporter substrate-binding protein [Nocardiopsis]ADH69925.1 Substrate-binding region of ABC-type glycine betaine transport system [Nocardiopsis dassonvillei subsp. dassonvillei DSM 43111]APC37910.1 glycine/betaine ABC transporter substrate-binding protein [Nocardiopsis dassonvillei]NKY77475.1 glycine betaine ABC transporter substrate-binding protein [Nocardiopsis dassonvillei]VEI90438.1 Glycine betaine-binding protein precursor [Nocardiopsis dassonvillei]